MPHRKSSGSRSVQAVPGKRMGNHGGLSLSARRKGYLAKVKGAEIVPANPLEPKMIMCKKSPGELVEMEVAFENLRNDDCRKGKGKCERCAPWS